MLHPPHANKLGGNQMAALDFDVIVVGSGFGGSVTAYRVAEAGFRLCVLERGQAYPPNSFARSPFTMNQAFWDPGNRRHGLFDVWSFGHMDAIVSAGLGGGSLIYANVLLRKDAAWFVAERDGVATPWPINRTDLNPHYDNVEAIIAPQTFPISAEPYSSVPKASQFKQAAERLGFHPTTYTEVTPDRAEWFLPPLAITFANKDRPPVPGETIHEPIRNLHDRDRQTCRLCGECDIGCNYGAKNTLDYNYLTLAKAKGADLRTLAEVISFHPTDNADGFVVDYRQHGVNAPAPAVLTHVTARHLVLSAGTFGTNYLMQANRANLPGVSHQLGRWFSGNGDLLTLVLNARQVQDGQPGERILDPSYGPVITSTLRSPDALDGAPDGARGFYLQDAGFPVFLDWLVQTSRVGFEFKELIRFASNRVAAHLHHGAPHLAPELESLLSDTSLSTASLPLLGMGRDVPTGTFGLDGSGQLTLDWDKKASSAFFEAVTELSQKMAEEMGGRFLQNPLTEYFNQLITVHGLGGCSIGADASTGVVDTYGRVFGVPRLHIADGSVVPSAVGANPSLTIAALADRFADQLIDELA
jgi:cholesterol oxidase